MIHLRSIEDRDYIVNQKQMTRQNQNNFQLLPGVSLHC